MDSKYVLKINKEPLSYHLSSSDAHKTMNDLTSSLLNDLLLLSKDTWCQPYSYSVDRTVVGETVISRHLKNNITISSGEILNHLEVKLNK